MMSSIKNACAGRKTSISRARSLLPKTSKTSAPPSFKRLSGRWNGNSRSSKLLTHERITMSSFALVASDATSETETDAPEPAPEQPAADITGENLKHIYDLEDDV